LLCSKCVSLPKVSLFLETRVLKEAIQRRL
jgi:hypothetical protein